MKKIKRPPIVVILGHVDHGKSSILEAIKDIKIIEKEAGGITQHIGAYEIEHEGKKITFIDTPGHEAFSAMRSRGAKIADIAILVIAADEGVKEQTKEAISHIKEYNLPFIVAANKIDKPTADPERVKRELSQVGVLLEEMGGDVPFVKVSAKTKKGITDLLELILLVAEMMNLETSLEGKAEGEVIEAFLDSKRGPLTTLIPKKGILKIGDIIGTFSTFGKVKSLENFQGERMEKVFPSSPALVLGFEKVPLIGEKFKVFNTLEEAKENIKIEETKEKIPQKKEGEPINLILKGDVLGSLEAIESSLREIPQKEAFFKILESRVGEVTENDVILAEETGAFIFAFRVKVSKKIKELALEKRVKIMEFEVIYELIEKAREMLEKKERAFTKEEKGRLKVLAVFRKEKEREIIGGKVMEGEVKKGNSFKILREDKEIGEGVVLNLQKDKKDVDKVEKGKECGLLIKGKEVREGDILIFY